jgi:hypothetical protein
MWFGSTVFRKREDPYFLSYDRRVPPAAKRVVLLYRFVFSMLSLLLFSCYYLPQAHDKLGEETANTQKDGGTQKNGLSDLRVKLCIRLFLCYHASHIETQNDTSWDTKDCRPRGGKQWTCTLTALSTADQIELWTDGKGWGWRECMDGREDWKDFLCPSMGITRA